MTTCRSRRWTGCGQPRSSPSAGRRPPGPGPTTRVTRCGWQPSYDVSSPTPRRQPRPPRRSSCGRGGREVRRCRAPDVLHPRRARAGRPGRGSPTHRAARLAAAIPGGSVVDLGCGIGGDLIAFARAGLIAAGIDHDPRASGDGPRQPRGTRPGRSGAGGRRHHVDPQRLRRRLRRPGSTRRSRSRLRRGRLDPAVAVGARPPDSGRARGEAGPRLPHDLVPDGVEAEWVSDGGDVKEAVLWSRGTRDHRSPRHRHRRGGLASLTSEDDPYAVGERTGARGRRLPLRARRCRDPGRSGHRGGGRRRRRAGRSAHRLRHQRRLVPHAVRPVLPGRRAPPLPREAAARRPCASAASVGSRSRSGACRSCRRSCASGSPCAATRRPPWCSPAWLGRARHCWSSPSDSPR